MASYQQAAQIFSRVARRSSRIEIMERSVYRPGRIETMSVSKVNAVPEG